MSLESAKGRAKNAKNQLRSIHTMVRRGEVPSEDSVEYAFNEVVESINEIEKELDS